MTSRDARKDARLCERVTRRHARTFALASYFLPARKRRAAFAIYAFCRRADDIVDSVDSECAVVAAESATLAAYTQRLDQALRGQPDDAVFRELAWVVDEFNLPTSVLHELVNGVACDLHHEAYASWSELERYCYAVASTVGIMCTYIFGVISGPTRDTVLRRAETLGVAMQLTNILRDVGEDARRGRCYLPLDDLTRFGIDPVEISQLTMRAADPRWHSLMQFEISRARELYARAHSGIASLHPDSQRCATACAVGYARILDAIEQIGYDTLTQRAQVPTRAKAVVLWHAWTRTAPAWLMEYATGSSVPA